MLAFAALASTLALACPQNLASGIDTPATTTRLVTVEAKVLRTTYAELRTWKKVRGCWVAAAGPYTARLGENGLSANNSFQHVRCGTRPPFGGASEEMWQQPKPYSYLAVIEYNLRPVVPGKGSGMFLHAQTGGPTIGCVSLRKAELRAVLRWLRPGAAPMIAIGSRAQLRSP